jgi:DNA segregation ATPase FtsK/SpoIIIE, S-DNA-T family
MTKRKKKENEDSEPSSLFENIKEETFHGILSIAFFILALFLVLSALGSAGVVGNAVFNKLSFFLGLGYYILPLLFSVISISFLKSLRRKFGVLKIAGAVLFFLSGLGLADTLFDKGGGYIGNFITSPLISLFDVYLSPIILWGILIISTLLIFDASLPSLSSFPSLQRIMRRNKEEDYMIEPPSEDMPEGNADEKGLDEESETSDEQEDVLETGFDAKSGDGMPHNAGAIRSAHRGKYTPPPLTILEKDRGKPGVGDIKANANIIKRMLQNFGVTVEIDEISIGPSVTRYALKPAEGVRLSKIVGLQNNLELALAAYPVRIEAPIPGRSLVGVEVPNSAKATVGIATILSSDNFQKSNNPLLVTLGKDISGHVHFADLAKMPHLLIAGATGSGKSVAIHSIITSLLYRSSPENLRFIMIDPKRVELTLYNNIPHLLTPVVTDAKKAILALKWASKEMSRRYDVLETESARDIESYHRKLIESQKKNKNAEEKYETMPYIVIVIDELADIMQMYPRELESAVVRLAQMSRAVGIHLVLSTQRPSVNVITGLIKANIPARMAFQVTSQVDSRTILDIGGAEKLLGAGDMLYISGEMSKPRRIQTAFISEEEVKRVTKFLVRNYADSAGNVVDFTAERNDSDARDALFSGTLDDEEFGEEDDMYDEARELIVRTGNASTSYLQRKLRLGYARAARLMDMLEERGVISPADGAKRRHVLERNDETEKREMEQINEQGERY